MPQNAHIHGLIKKLKTAGPLINHAREHKSDCLPHTVREMVREAKPSPGITAGDLQKTEHFGVIKTFILLLDILCYVDLQYLNSANTFFLLFGLFPLEKEERIAKEKEQGIYKEKVSVSSL